jgi:hypothetical protein
MNGCTYPNCRCMVTTAGPVCERDTASLVKDAQRWRTLCVNFGNERDEATPGKPHALRITLNPDGCEVLKPDGTLDWSATLAAVMDDEARIQSSTVAAGVKGPEHG